MPLHATLAALTLAAAPLAAVPVSAAATTAALPQCQTSEFVHAGNGWYANQPGDWESSSLRCDLKYGDLPHRDPDLPFGDPAAAIRALQRNLNYCYGAGLTVDGRYGAKTHDAVMAVQRKHRITVDGVYGPQTRSAMYWRLYSSKTKAWSMYCYSPF